jgi:hypothetical protein
MRSRFTPQGLSQPVKEIWRDRRAIGTRIRFFFSEWRSVAVRPAKDPPPGKMVVWRGLTRRIDSHIGFELSSRIVGR